MTVVTFHVAPAPELAHLEGQPHAFGKMRNPALYVDTAAVTGGDVEIEENQDGDRRAVVGAFTLIVTDVDSAQVHGPAGSSVLVRLAS